MTTELEQDVIDSGGWIHYVSTLENYALMFSIINDIGGFPKVNTARAIPNTEEVERGINGEALVKIQVEKITPYTAALEAAIETGKIQQVLKADFEALRIPEPSE